MPVKKKFTWNSPRTILQLYYTQRKRILISENVYGPRGQVKSYEYEIETSARLFILVEALEQCDQLITRAKQ